MFSALFSLVVGTVSDDLVAAIKASNLTAAQTALTAGADANVAFDNLTAIGLVFDYVKSSESLRYSFFEALLDKNANPDQVVADAHTPRGNETAVTEFYRQRSSLRVR